MTDWLLFWSWAVTEPPLMMLQWKTKHCKTKSLLGQCHGRGGGHQPQHQHDNDNDDEEDVDDIAENLCVWKHRGGWPLASTEVGSGQSRGIKCQRNTLPIFQRNTLLMIQRNTLPIFQRNTLLIIQRNTLSYFREILSWLIKEILSHI